MSRRLGTAIALALALAVLAGAAYVVLGAIAERRSHAWKQADLDRNRLDLAISRGAETGQDLARAIDYGTVVASSGTSPHTVGGDAEVIVDYPEDATDWFGGETGEVRHTCYAFRDRDGYHVDFDRVDCP